MLPNVPLLGSAWDVAETTTTIPGLVWTEVVPADPMRWFLSFSAPSAGNILVSTSADDFRGLLKGILLPNTGGTVDIEFWKHGPLVNSAWYAFPTVSATQITVFTASIRRQIRPQRSSDNVL